MPVDGSTEAIRVASYAPDGTEQWATTYAFDGTDTRATDVAVGPSDAIYVSGRTDSGRDADWLVAKFDGTGTHQWTRTHDAAGRFDSANGASGTEGWATTYDGGGFDRATDIAVTDGGTLYVTGVTETAGASTWLTVQYDASGTSGWQETYDDAGARAHAVAVDAGGHVYVAGHRNASETHPDWRVVTYDP